MKAWNQITHYAGFDWAKDHHDVIVLDSSGKIVADFRFEHTAGGWEQFREKLAAFTGVAVAVETKSGTVIERLQEIDCCIFPMHPQSAKAYRQRKVPSGNKTDHVDAWSLADALRLDGANWKQLAPQEPLIKELRLLCRDEVALIRDRTALITQLRQTLSASARRKIGLAQKARWAKVKGVEVAPVTRKRRRMSAAGRARIAAAAKARWAKFRSSGPT